MNKLFEVHYTHNDDGDHHPAGTRGETFPEYVNSKIRSADQFGTEFDMLLISLVMNVNVRCIFNGAKEFIEHNSRDVINELITALDDAGIDTSAYDGALSKNAVDLWLYGHQHGFPMDPENIEKLNHFCALKQKHTVIDANTRLLAYKGAVVEDADSDAPKKKETKINKRAAILKGEKTKQKRRRLTMKEQYDIVQKFEVNPKLGHKEVALQYGIARTTVSTVLKRKDLIKMEIGIALVRDKKYQAKTCRRIFTSDYSQYKAIDWALFDWMQQTSKDSKDQNFTSEVLKQKALFFAEKAGIADFHASEGWLNGFKNRFGMANLKKRGRGKAKGSSAAMATFVDLDDEAIQNIENDLDAGMDPDDNCDDTILKKAKLNVASHGAAVQKSKETTGVRGRKKSDTNKIPDEEIILPPDVAAALEIVRKYANEGSDDSKINATVQVLEKKLKRQERKTMEAKESQDAEIGYDIENEAHEAVAHNIVEELSLKPEYIVEGLPMQPECIDQELAMKPEADGQYPTINPEYVDDALAKPESVIEDENNINVMGV